MAPAPIALHFQSIAWLRFLRYIALHFPHCLKHPNILHCFWYKNERSHCYLQCLVKLSLIFLTRSNSLPCVILTHDPSCLWAPLHLQWTVSARTDLLPPPVLRLCFSARGLAWMPLAKPWSCLEFNVPRGKLHPVKNTSWLISTPSTPYISGTFLFLFLFNWRIIALQYSVGLCPTSTWIRHRYPYVPSLWSFPPTAHIPPL